MRLLRSSPSLGALPPNPRDFPPSRQNIPVASQLGAAPPNPAGILAGGRRTRRLPLFRPLSRRSGCVPAEPYPPLRFFQSGLHQPCRATITVRTATTPLTSCLTPGVHFKSPRDCSR